MRYTGSFVFVVGNSSSILLLLPQVPRLTMVSDNIVFDTILQNAPKFQKLDKHMYAGKNKTTLCS